MRAVACIIVATVSLTASSTFAEDSRPATAFWRSVQETCDATAARPAGALGRRLARSAIDEFVGFGGHQIDASGRLFRFGLTEAEHKQEGGNGNETRFGDLGWWRVMKYWRALYGFNVGEFKDELEVRGYRDAAASKDAAQIAALLEIDFGPLLRTTENVKDPDQRETLREAVIRAAIVDTPWSAAFISYVIRQAGATPDGFQFANAHRAYIYDAFATSAAEVARATNGRLYRACPLVTTTPRIGDLICSQRETELTDKSETAIRERIRVELGTNGRSVQRTHCEVVAHIDTAARKMYTIGGNVLHAVTARKLNLRRDLKFSGVQSGKCGGTADWTMPGPAMKGARAASRCSLNDQKWFVLLQLR